MQYFFKKYKSDFLSFIIWPNGSFPYHVKNKFSAVGVWAHTNEEKVDPYDFNLFKKNKTRQLCSVHRTNSLKKFIFGKTICFITINIHTIP